MELYFLNALYREYDNIDNPKPDQFKRYIKIEKGVLYLFGATQWDSARQIKTVCRVATSKKTFIWNKPISLDNFKGITNSKEFVKTWLYLKDKTECIRCRTSKSVDKCDECKKNIKDFNEVILVKFPS